MNIIEHTDEEILAEAHPMWEDLIKYSNEGEYGKFIRKFALIRRNEHVTALYRMRSTKKEGEWLGRLVLGYDKEGEIKIFGASIF